MNSKGNTKFEEGTHLLIQEDKGKNKTSNVVASQGTKLAHGLQFS